MGRILAADHNGVYLLRFEGDVRVTLCATADDYFNRMYEDPKFKSVLVDLSVTEGIDSTSLGLLARLSIEAKKRFNFVPTLVCRSPDLLRILHSVGFDDVFNIVEETPVTPDALGELPRMDVCEDELRAQVLDAHRALMSVNASNREAFRDLVAVLEAEDLGSLHSNPAKRA